MQNADPEQMFQLDAASVRWLASSIPSPYSTLRIKLSTCDMPWRTYGKFIKEQAHKDEKML